MRRLVSMTSEADIMKCIHLSEYAFQRKLSQEELNQVKLKYQEHEVIGIKQGENLISKLNIIPFEVQIEQQDMKMGGIGGVATWPEERRKGTVRQLLIKSLEIMRENHQTISFLHPFNISFYRKFGWELVFYEKVFTIKCEHLTPFEQSDGYVRRLDKLEGLSEVGKLYEQYRKRYNGLLKRDEDDWMTNILSDPFMLAVYYSNDGLALGYLLYKLENQKLIVEEWVDLHHESRCGLWNFLCQHDSMIEQLEITVHPDDGLDFFLHEPKIKQEIHPYMMARITDIQSFLQHYPLRNLIEEPFVFQITDEVAEWNNQTLQVDRHDVEAVNAETAKNLITIDIQSFTAFLLGARTALFFYQAGKLVGNSEEVMRLDETVVPLTPWLMDYF
ncbi:GNAT family N-acetyltransferase [Bacillus sp. CLL-7-23]|uniref:GNAT family N-acetyltransferase n=1 Tax=Bacillus changyiensis TaxID=3004103 RepID=A0ABT4WZ25_9BACI|nr:GNAT family N-acetyltransferase [Bacillus changyiensis]MDA7025303.1 GNAT family N-acetyltransferase [Bacillus changyiensis]